MEKLIVVQFEDIVVRITSTFSDLQSGEQRGKTLREKSENSRNMVSRDDVS